MNALLSIKPEFAKKILKGDKQYEFRRTSFRDSEAVETVYLYASSPVQEIVGAFTLEGVIKAHPEDLWEEFGEKSGIEEKQRFMQYYEGTDTGYAFDIRDTQEFQKSIDPWTLEENFVPPTSFHYLSGDLLSDLQKNLDTSLNPRQAAIVPQYSSD